MSDPEYAQTVDQPFDAQLVAMQFQAGSKETLAQVAEVNEYFIAENLEDVAVGAASEDSSHVSKSGMPVSFYSVPDFIGGVVYALAARGRITAESATPDRTSAVCYYLGRLLEAESMLKYAKAQEQRARQRTRN